MTVNLSVLKKTALVLMVIAGAMLPANEGRAASSTKNPEDKGTAHKEHPEAFKPKGFWASHTTEIEFFAALSIVGLSVVIPDLIRKQKARASSKSAKSSSTEQANQPSELEVHPNKGVPHIKEVKMNNQRKNRRERNQKRAA